MKKTKLLLPALTLSMLGTAIGGGCLVAAAAEPQPRTGPTIGEFNVDAGYELNGTSDSVAESKTTITYQWDSAGFSRVAIEVAGVTASSSIDLSFTSTSDATVHLMLGNGQWDWTGVYGSPIADGTVMTANTALEKTISLADVNLESNTDVWLLIYFDKNTVTDEAKTITVNTLSVDGVSYTPLLQKGVIAAPDKAVKEYAEWTVTNGTVAANTLEKLEGEAAEGTVDNGAGNVTITDTAQLTTIEIPLNGSFGIDAWPTVWNNLYIKYKMNNVKYIDMYFNSVETEREGEAGKLDQTHIFVNHLDAWNFSTTPSLMSEGYISGTVSIGGYVDAFLNGTDIKDWSKDPPELLGHADGHDAITKLVLVIEADDTTKAASLEIAGITMNKKAPTFINDINTKLTIGAWAAVSSDITVTEKGTVDGYTGIKASWDKTITGDAVVYAPIINFDATKTPKLHVGFYTDSAFTLSVYCENACVSEWGKTYEKGYHDLDLDVSAIKDSAFNLKLWTDNGATVEAAKNVVFDVITFYNGEDVSIQLDKAEKDGLFKAPTYKDGKLILEWDAKDAGAFYKVSIPVANWHSFDRVLHMNVTLSHDTALGIWGGEAFTDTVLGNSNHPKLGAGTYDLWLYASSTKFIDDGVSNDIQIYCDIGNASETSIAKTLTINSIEFVEKAPKTSSPNGNNITVNYLEQKITFEAAYEVATDKDFENKLESGATVTPGAPLYLRAADGSSATTVVTLPETTLTKDTAPEATVGENFIRFGASGYEYKFGDNGEWVTLGSWGNLAADTEFTIYVRVRATDTSFASEAVELKIKTSAAAGTPDDSVTPDPDDKTEEKKSGCGSIIGLGSLGLAALAAMAVGTAVIVKKKKD